MTRQWTCVLLALCWLLVFAARGDGEYCWMQRLPQRPRMHPRREESDCSEGIARSGHDRQDSRLRSRLRGAQVRGGEGTA